MFDPSSFFCLCSSSLPPICVLCSWVFPLVFPPTPRILSYVTGNLTELLVLPYFLSPLYLLDMLYLLLLLLVPSHHKNVCAIAFLSSFCCRRRLFRLFMFAMLRLSSFCIWNRRAWKHYDLILIWRSDMIWIHNPARPYPMGKTTL